MRATLKSLLLVTLVTLIVSSPASFAQSFTHADFDSWVLEANSGTVPWNGVDGAITVSVQITGNPRSGYPEGNSHVFDYQETWFDTWFDDAGVTDTTHIPDVIGVWNDGDDEIVITFDRNLDGQSNFLAFHQNDFSTTFYTLEAFLDDEPLDYNLIELNNSSGSMFITNNGSSITLNDPNADQARRHLIRFNQPFDEVRILENNLNDLTAYAFFGTGAVVPEPAVGCLIMMGLPFLLRRRG